MRTTALMMLVVVLLLWIGVAVAADVYTRGYWKDTNDDGIKDTWVNP